MADHLILPQLSLIAYVRDSGLNILYHSCGFARQKRVLKISCPWVSPLQTWGSLIIALLSKFAYIWLTILSCYSSISVSYGDCEGYWFEHSVLQLRVSLLTEGFCMCMYIYIYIYIIFYTYIYNFLYIYI